MLGGMLPGDILKSRLSEMAFPALTSTINAKMDNIVL